MRIHRRGMGSACRGGGAIAGVFSQVTPTGRRDAAAVLVYSVRTVSLSLGTTGTIGRLQVVEKAPVTEQWTCQ